MGYYEENILYKDLFFQHLLEHKTMQKLKNRRPEPIIDFMSLYDTLLPGCDILEDDDLFASFGPLDGKRFQVYLKSMRLFGENIRLHLKERREETICKTSHKD